MDNIQNLNGIRLCKRLQRIQAFTVSGNSHRDDRKTFHKRKKSHQIPDGPFQRFAVIDPFAQNDLSIHDRSGGIKLCDLFHDFSRKAVVKHHAAKLRIRRMHGNIDR